MIHSISKRVAFFMLLYGDAKKEDEDIYVYACELIISSLFNVIFSCLIAVLFGKIFETLAFVVCFVFLRQATGGYHAKTHFMCILTFASILTFSLLLLDVIIVPAFYVFVSFAATLAIFFIAPVEHKDNPITPKLRFTLRQRSRIISSVIFFSIAIGVFVCKSLLFPAMALSMLAVSGGMICVASINNNITQERRFGEP